MQKILPVSYPEISAFPHYANLLSVLSTDKDMMMPWVYNNFIQLQFRKHEGHRLDFCICMDYYMIKNNCPWIYRDGVSRDLIYKKWGSLTDFIIDAIDDEYYVDIVVDEYYIKEYDAFHKRYFEHNLMIYGYDKEKKIFYVADSFKDGKYYYATVTFDEIEQSALTKNYYKYCESVIIFKKAYRPTQHNFNTITIKDYIYDYLNSLNSHLRNAIFSDSSIERQAHMYVFGLAVYDEMKKYIQDTDEIIHSIPCALNDHKKIMWLMIEYLIKEKYLYDDGHDYLGKIEDTHMKANVVVNLSLKYNLTKNKNIVGKICDILSEIQAIEELLYQQIYDNIHTKQYLRDPHLVFEADILTQDGSCHCVAIDNSSSGDWKSRYGKEGVVLPEYSDVKVNGFEYYIKTLETYTAVEETDDIRALENMDISSKRKAICFCNTKNLEVSFYAEEEINITFYFVDWHKSILSGKIEAHDVKNTLLSSENINQFYNGVYYTYKIKGYVKFRIEFIDLLDNENRFGEVYGIFLN